MIIWRSGSIAEPILKKDGKMKAELISIIFAGLVYSAASHAGVCKIDASARDNCPFKVVDAATGENIAGVCGRTIDDSFKVFRQLEETGQCSPNPAPPECVVRKSCSNIHFPLAIIDVASGANSFGKCFDDVEVIENHFNILKYTGQCAEPQSPEPCNVDAKCGRSDTPYRIYHRFSGDNFLGRCYASMDDAMTTFRSLKRMSLCGM